MHEHSGPAKSRKGWPYVYRVLRHEEVRDGALRVPKPGLVEIRHSRPRDFQSILARAVGEGNSTTSPMLHTATTVDSVRWILDEQRKSTDYSEVVVRIDTRYLAETQILDLSSRWAQKQWLVAPDGCPYTR